MSFVMTEQMKREALTTIKVYLTEPFEGQEDLRRYSLDGSRNRRFGIDEPGMDKLYELFVKPHIGIRLRCAFIYVNQYPGFGKALRMYNAHGLLESQKFLNKEDSFQSNQ